MYKIGVDVGGTNTDAVILSQGKVIRAIKCPTLPDVGEGLAAAITALLRDDIATSECSAVIVGTTHFLNAVLQRRGLSKVAAIRLGLPVDGGVPPASDWPEDLSSQVLDSVHGVSGGFEYDGREMAPLDEAAVRRIASELRQQAVSSVAVCGMFAPVSGIQEERAAALIRDEYPAANISISAQFGGIGLIERENSCILNASLLPLARDTINGMVSAVRTTGLSAPVYLTRNDGTILGLEQASQFPVFCFASGVTNSMRGAAFLSSKANAVVIDVGGTTSDIGVLRQGFPRQANAAVDIGGVRTLFRMPDTVSVAIGGGSIVAGDRVGPSSVGYRITSDAYVFGGHILTATDIGVAQGLVSIGTHQPPAISPEVIDNALLFVQHRLTEAIDAIRDPGDTYDVLAVGGGAFLVPDTLPGARSVLRVPHGDVANAVGAALAQVSGECDTVFRSVGRDDAIARAVAIAQTDAVRNGARQDSLRTLDIEEVAIPYSTENAIRVRARVVGSMVTDP